MNQVPTQVLDHGFVRLVDVMGSDLSIVRAARVSHNADWRAGLEEGSDSKLIRYLWKHKHGTPFEAGILTFEVKAPIFIFRQWHRHRTQSYNEVSARYTELPEEFYVPEWAHVGRQSTKDKQAREINKDSGNYEAIVAQIQQYKEECRHSFQLYKILLEDGWPREMARMVLPLSTYSRMFTTMNVRNFFGFLALRLDRHAQWEIRQYAEAMLSLADQHFPVACEAFREGVADG